YYSLFIFVVCVVLSIAVSYLTPAPNSQQISGLTFGTITEDHQRESRSSWDWRDVSLSILLVALILAAYLYFTG
ncbi:MAG: Na+/glucose cotransporter, partial [Candidatus Hinthialibacter sp.]